MKEVVDSRKKDRKCHAEAVQGECGDHEESEGHHGIEKNAPPRRANPAHPLVLRGREPPTPTSSSSSSREAVLRHRNSGSETVSRGQESRVSRSLAMSSSTAGFHQRNRRPTPWDTASRNRATAEEDGRPLSRSPRVSWIKRPWGSKP